MSDVMRPVTTAAAGIKNGSIVTLVFETGQTQERNPDVNQFVPSGTIVSRLDERFDEHYGGGTS